MGKKESNSQTEIPRRNYDFYGLSKQLVKELRIRCKEGLYSPETLQEACAGFEWLAPWILLSVQKGLSYDRMQTQWELGRLERPAVSRTDFYSCRRRFFYNLSNISLYEKSRDDVKGE